MLLFYESVWSTGSIVVYFILLSFLTQPRLLGAASRYEIHYTFDETSRLVSDFESLPLLTNDSVLAGGDLNAPKSPGSLESFVVNISDLPEATDQVIKCTPLFVLQLENKK